MKNRIIVRHGMLGDLADYLRKSGWTLESTAGIYEVLRARKQGYPRPLLIYDRSSGGCGYSIDERDIKVFQGWKLNRRKCGLDPDWPDAPRCEPVECEPRFGGKRDCEFNEYGYCVAPHIFVANRYN